MPSAFSHEILNANPYAYLDDAPLEERRARAVEMRRVLPEAVLTEIGRLDPAAIEEVRAEAWPDVRDADELHDALLTLGALPLEAGGKGGGVLASRCGRRFRAWQEFRGIAAAAPGAGGDGLRRDILGAERTSEAVCADFPGRAIQQAPPEVGEAAGKRASREDAIFGMVTGWIAHSGPVTARN